VLERVPQRVLQAVVAVGCLWLVGVWVTHRVVGGDTPWLVDGTDQIVRCLAAGELVKCGYTGVLSATGQTTTIGPYPLLQYIPDLIARSLGATHNSRYAVLALLSTAAVATTVAVAACVFLKLGRGVWFWGFLAVVLSGPVLVYANTTWGEMLATGLLVFLVAAAVVPVSPALFGLTAFAASLTKETSYPFVAAFGLLGLVLARRRTGHSIRSHLLAGAGGIVVAIACAIAFNILRFGAVQNTNYLREEFTAPVARMPEIALGLYVAPNGGILIFWTSAALLLIALLTLPLLTRPHSVDERFDRKVAVGLAGVVAALTVVLASWYSPFGWIAWGPRLSLPWVLPIVLLALVAFGDAFGVTARRLLAAPWRFLLVLLALLAVTLPQVGYLWRPETKDEFFALNRANPDCSAPVGSSGYYACLHETMWSRRPIVNDALRGLGEPGGAVTAVIVGAALLGSLALLRDGLIRAYPARRPMHRAETDDDATHARADKGTSQPPTRIPYTCSTSARPGARP
jgi:hypothetical protein